MPLFRPQLLSISRSALRSPRLVTASRTPPPRLPIPSLQTRLVSSKPDKDESSPRDPSSSPTHNPEQAEPRFTVHPSLAKRLDREMRWQEWEERHLPRFIYIYTRFLRRPPIQRLIILMTISGTVFYLWNLEKVPVTGRSRFNWKSDATMDQLGKAAATQMMIKTQGRRLKGDDERLVRVRRIVERLLAVKGWEEELRLREGRKWMINVIDDESNAFVVSGGYIFVATGLLNLCPSDGMVAAVLAHEIAHQVAKHSAERASSQSWTSPVLCTVASLFTLGMPLAFMLAHSVYYAKEAPKSRIIEAEADQIGLMLMADACYDPREAIMFFEAMEREDAKRKEVGAKRLQTDREWTSTHPLNKTRISKIMSLLPSVTERRSARGCAALSSDFAGFQDAIRDLRETLPE